MTDFLNNLFFIFQRLTWSSIVDILLVTLILFGLLYLIRDTQAMVLLRGVIFIIVLLVFLTTFFDLPAFRWLVQTILPALLLAVPVIFAPEIRRGLERIGRAGTFIPTGRLLADSEMQAAIQGIVGAAARLAAREHGALIILQRLDNLEEFVRTGVQMDARVSIELLLQIFYPNTPLHDGGVIVSADGKIISAACVMPLSASGILERTPESQMGLRHRAGLGISEVSDAVAVIVSEEAGSISVAHAGRMIRNIDAERLENILNAFYRPTQPRESWMERSFPYLFKEKE